MKKLALLTALALSINCFACFAASAEETTEPTETTAFSHEMDFNSITPAAWSSLAPDSNYWTVNGTQLFYQKLDDEHGVSLRFMKTASPKIAFNFPAAVSGEARISFDIYLEDSVNKTISLFTNAASWSEMRFITIGGTTLRNDRTGNSIGELSTKQWHRIDIIITSKPDINDATKLSTYMDFYLDGKKDSAESISRAYFGQKQVTGIGFLKDGGGDGTGDVYIDNFSASYPRGSETFKAAMNTDGTKITFNRTIARSTIPENAVEVKAISLVDGTEKNVAVTAEANVSATALDLIYAEPMESSNYKYEYTLSDSIKGIFGETLANTSFEYTTDVDYYQSLTDIAAGTVIPIIGRAGVYDGDWNLKDATKLNRVNFAKSWAGVDGLVIQQKRVLVTPKRLTSGKYAISFDLYNQQSEMTYLTLGDMSSSGEDTSLLFFDLAKDKGDVINLGPDWNNPNKKIGTHAVRTWKHYDLVFNLGRNVEVWQDGTKLGEMAYTRGLDYLFFAGSDNGRAIQNLHMRNLYTDDSGNVTNKNIVTTTLDGAVAAGTTTAKVTFRDPINPELITNQTFNLTNEDGDDIAVAVSDVTPYGATLTFATPLQKSVDYSLSIGNIKAYLGESLSKTSVDFSPVDMHRVTDIYASVNDTKIESVSAWNNTDDIKITAALESTRGAGEVYVVAAGYDAAGKMLGAGLATLEVNGSGSYSANLGKLDLTGAASIRYFAIDSMENMAPLTSSVISIN